jgi:hypothetical protein
MSETERSRCPIPVNWGSSMSLSLSRGCRMLTRLMPDIPVLVPCPDHSGGRWSNWA